MRHKLTRMVAAAAMFGSAVIFGGGTLIAAPNAASASTGGTNVCSSLAGTVDLSTGMVTNRYSGCHEHGSATAVGSTTRLSVHWATGNATSDVVVSAVVDPSGSPCPAGEITFHVTLTVVAGAYNGSTGHNIACDDISAFPIIHVTNFGPLVI